MLKSSKDELVVIVLYITCTSKYVAQLFPHVSHAVCAVLASCARARLRCKVVRCCRRIVHGGRAMPQDSIIGLVWHLVAGLHVEGPDGSGEHDDVGILLIGHGIVFEVSVPLPLPFHQRG